MTNKALFLTVTILCFFVVAVMAGTPVRRADMVFTTTHTVLNGVGVSKEIPYDCYLRSISIKYSAAQTSTSIVTVDSGEGSSFDYRLNTASLTGATSELITFDEGEVLLKKFNSKRTDSPDAILFQAEGADAATVAIIITLEKVRADDR